MARLSRPWKELKQNLYRDPKFRKAYEELEPEFQLARAIIALRAAKGLTQEEMAERAEIKQPMLSRPEGAKDLPTLPTLARLAAAIGAKVEVRFVDRKNRELRRVPPIRVWHKPVVASHERAR
ncbi:MAG: helix-turn-helix domain-containing protein [Armatimonadota bacterium]